MRSTAFYGHHPEEVEVVETHISWVFLAGDRAFKLRKPVVFPFLDYGTAARRREMCEEEVPPMDALASVAEGAGFAEVLDSLR